MDTKFGISGQSMQEILSYTTSTSGFRVTERWFSDDQSHISIGIANIHTGVKDIEANKNKILHAIDIFKEKKVNLAIFPEFCLSGYFWEDEEECRRFMDQAVIDNHSQWIDEILRSYLDDTLKGIVLNCLRKGQSGKFINSTYYINKEDDFLRTNHFYDKVFLPKIEKLYTETTGDDLLVLEGEYGRFGFTTCYDICFSQLLLEYSKIEQVDAIIEVASWRSLAFRDYPGMNVGTDTYYAALWDMILPAQAATNQVWIIACNSVGRHEISGAEFAGGSGLWSPSGMKLVQASRFNEELLIVHNIDIHGQLKIEKDDFNYALDFNDTYRPVDCRRCFTRI
jgi:predicted amidohydrolase